MSIDLCGFGFQGGGGSTSGLLTGAANGLSLSGTTVILGGSLIQNTSISITGFQYRVTNSGNNVAAFDLYSLYNSSGVNTLNWDSRQLITNTAQTVRTWGIQNAAGDFDFFIGTSQPNGTITGSPMDLYLLNNGGIATIYIKRTGSATNTGWVDLLTGSTGWSLTGNSGLSAGTPATNFLGTTDATDLVFKTNSTENVRILNSNGYFGIGISPVARLDVKATANDTSALVSRLVSANEARYWQTYANMASVMVTDYNGTLLQLATSGAVGEFILDGGTTSIITWKSNGTTRSQESASSAQVIKFMATGIDYYIQNGSGTNYFFYKQSTNRFFLGISDTPDAMLHIRGEGNNGLTKAVRVDDTSLNQMFVILNSGLVGVGSAVPDSKFTVSEQSSIVAPVSGSTIHYVGLDANPLRMTFDTHNTGTSGTAFMGRRSRGTSAAPSAVAAGDTIVTFNGLGYGNTNYASASTGLISIKANETFTDSAMGTYIAFFTTPDGSVSATETMRITGSGTLLLGNPTATGRAFDIKQDTSIISIGSLIGSTGNGAIYINQASPSATNYVISSNSNGLNLNAAGAGSPVQILINNSPRIIVNNTNVSFTHAGATSGSTSPFTFTSASTTGQTASTEVISFNLNLSAALQHAAGALTTQRTMVVQATTYAFVSASTITNAATFAVTNAPIAGTNCTITNAYSIWAQSGISRFDGGTIVGTNGGLVTSVLTASATLDFPNTAAGTKSDLTVTVTGASLNDVVSLGVPNGSISATDNVLFFAWVSAADTVTVRFINANTVTAVDPASGTFKIKVTKQ